VEVPSDLKRTGKSFQQKYINDVCISINFKNSTDMHKFFLYVFSVLLLASCSKESDLPAPDTTSRFQEISSKSEFDAVINSGVSLMMFHSPGCSICNRQKPLVEDAANDEEMAQAQFFLVDVTRHRDITSAHNINGYPIIVIFKDNKEMNRLVGGGHSTKKLKDIIKALL
jgi:thiol-disulfide isomerase/thioredoxin